MISGIDQLILLAYLAGMLGMGFYFSRKNNSTEHYFLGGRRFSGWVIGLSLVGTSISSITFLAYPADSFKTGWLRYLPNLMLPIAVYLAIKFFLPHFRKEGTTTAYQFLELRFGRSIRKYSASVFLLGQLVRVSIILYLLSILLQTLTGMDPTLAIVICGLAVATYTYFGGIDAVIWTDVVQTVVLAFGGLFCLWVIVDQLPGGLGQIFESAAAAGKFNVAEWQDGVAQPVKWQLTFSEKTLTMMLMLGLVHWLTEYSANQNTVQRFCAARSTEDAKKSLWICAAASLPIWAFYMFLGTALWVFFNHIDDQFAAAVLSGETKAEQILPYFITEYLSVGVVGLVLAAALAAAMSSLDSSINAIATVTTVDLYQTTARGARSTDQQRLRLAKRITLVASAVMIIGAYLFQSATMKTLQDSMTAIVSILSGGLFGLYCLAFFTSVRSTAAVWSAIAVTLCFSVWALFVSKGWIETEHLAFDLYYTAIAANIILFVVGGALGWLFQKRQAQGDSRRQDQQQNQTINLGGQAAQDG